MAISDLGRASLRGFSRKGKIDTAQGADPFKFSMNKGFRLETRNPH